MTGGELSRRGIVRIPIMASFCCDRRGLCLEGVCPHTIKNQATPSVIATIVRTIFIDGSCILFLFSREFNILTYTSQVNNSTNLVSKSLINVYGDYNTIIVYHYIHCIFTQTAHPKMNLFAPNNVHHLMNTVSLEYLYLSCNDVCDYGQKT